MTRTSPAPESCAVCSTPVPDWPAGWLRTDDGTNLCPKHKARVLLFPGRRGHVVPGTVWNWITGLAAEAGLEGVTPHRLRHTALATANDVTGDLRSMQTFARHGDPRVTAGYTRTTERRLQAVIDALRYEEAND